MSYRYISGPVREIKDGNQYFAFEIYTSSKLNPKRFLQKLKHNDRFNYGYLIAKPDLAVIEHISDHDWAKVLVENHNKFTTIQLYHTVNVQPGADLRSYLKHHSAIEDRLGEYKLLDVDRPDKILSIEPEQELDMGLGLKLSEVLLQYELYELGLRMGLLKTRPSTGQP